MNVTGPVKLKHEAPTDHVPQSPIGLNPVPGLAKLYGQCASAVIRIVFNQVVYKGDIFRGRDPTVNLIAIFENKNTFIFSIYEPKNIYSQ